jgi:carbamoyl-phosphate synthase large subunit
VEAILAGEIDLIVNTPYGVGSRLDGYEIRTAAVLRGVPCITTAQGLAAAVQGIEALISGDIGVRSLQEHAAGLAEARKRTPLRAAEPPRVAVRQQIPAAGAGERR